MALRNGAQRTKELLRYFETDDLAHLSFTKESSALNDALLPHLQLLAISCHVDHVFVSVFDRSQLYIIAEATAEPSQARYRFGCAGNSLEGKLCTYALELESTNKEAQPIFQISDLQYDERFNELPFIKDPHGPRYRFYAGTPIVSDHGVNIGTVAVFAAQPRTSLSTAEERYVREGTKRIKDYLELRREAAAGSRLGALTSNFTNFVHEISLDAFPTANAAVHGNTGAYHDYSNTNGATEARKSGYSATDMKQIFNKAVHSIENALQLDSKGGVLFLKANSSFVTSAIAEPESSLKKSNRRIIACSASVQDRLSRVSSTDLDSLATEDLKGLVGSSPRGRLWQYDSHGILSDDASGQQASSLQSSSRNSMTWPNLLRRMFLHVRQIAFVPLLNAATGEWQDVCFVWSSYSARMLNEIDLVMILNYGQAVMTERAIQDALKSSLQKSDFLGSMSHELRTPLHGILTSLEMLQQDQSFSAHQSMMLETIGTCGTALLDTINHILEFSKINTFQSSDNSTQSADELARQEVNGLTDLAIRFDLASLLEEVTDMVLFSATKTSNTVSASSGPCIILDISKEDWSLRLHKGAITRILMNIIGNAIKYTQNGSIRVELSLERGGNLDNIESTNQHILLKFTDTGIGMSLDFLESRAFIPFTQEDPLTPGVGLGLPICKKIVTDLGGNISIQSEKGLGTIVTIEIPLLEDPQVQSQGSSPNNGNVIPDLASSLDSLNGLTHPGSTQFAYLPSGDTQLSSLQRSLAGSICRYLTQWFGFEHILDTSLSMPNMLVLEEDYLLQLQEDQSSELLSNDCRLLLICTSLDSQVQLQQRMEDLQISNFRILCVPCGPYKLASCISSLFSVNVSGIGAHRRSIKSKKSSSLQRSIEVSSNPNIGSSEPDSPNISRAPDSVNVQNGHLSNNGLFQLPVRERQSPSKATDDISTTTNQQSLHQISTDRSIKSTTSTLNKPIEKPRLLLVDDNEINLRLLHSFCQKRNYGDVKLATDGQIAVDLVCQSPTDEPFDIILMDISMPVMNGFDATRAIREHEKKMRLKNATIIALTGLANERDQARGLESGMDMYLTKPVKFKDLGGILDEKLCV